MVDHLGLRERYRSAVQSDSGFISRTVTLPKATLGELAVTDLAMDSIPTADELDGLAPAGLIGFSLLACVDVRIDYDAKTVEAIDPASYRVPEAPATTVLDADLGDSVPTVAAAIDDVPATRFVIDTGSQGGVLFFPQFAEKHARALRTVTGSASRDVGVGGGGFAVDEVDVKQFVFGGVRFNNARLRRARVRGALNSDGLDGLIGNDVLIGFVLTTDYPHERVILEPGKILRSYGRKT